MEKAMILPSRSKLKTSDDLMLYGIDILKTDKNGNITRIDLKEFYMTPQQRIEYLEAELAKLKAQIAEKPVGRWKPEYADAYWCVDAFDGAAETITWDNDTFDNHRHKIGNCFKTQEEAKTIGKLRFVTFPEVWQRMHDLANFEPDWEDSTQAKWGVYLEDGKSLRLYDWYGDKHSNLPHFRSEAELKAAIDDIGEDKIISVLRGM